jgi:hypothetical protein
MDRTKTKAEIIPQKIVNEVALRKKMAAQGINICVSRKRAWGSNLAHPLLNDTVDAEIIPDKELPPSTGINGVAP